MYVLFLLAPDADGLADKISRNHRVGTPKNLTITALVLFSCKFVFHLIKTSQLVHFSAILDYLVQEFC